MKTSDMAGVLVGAAAAAAVLTMIFGTGRAKQFVQDAADKAAEIFGADGERYDNGWRYFTDGTAIDEKGNYYHKGQLIWRSPESYLT